MDKNNHGPSYIIALSRSLGSRHGVEAEEVIDRILEHYTTCRSHLAVRLQYPLPVPFASLYLVWSGTQTASSPSYRSASPSRRNITLYYGGEGGEEEGREPEHCEHIAGIFRQTKPPYEKDFCNTTMQQHRNYSARLHVDKNNHGPPYIIAVGEYEGGKQRC